MIVYLSHPLQPRDLQGPWASLWNNLARVRGLALGLQTLEPDRVFRYPHPFVAALEEKHRHEYRTGPIDVRAIRQRLMAGDGPQTAGGYGPHRTGAVAPAPPVDRVWVVGPDCADVAEDLAVAEELGLPVVLMPLEAQQAILGVALKVTAESARARADAPEGDMDFAGPVAVVRAYFDGMAGLLGAPAIDPARQAVRKSGNAHAVMERIHMATARLALAAAVMERAQADPKWCQPFLTVLRTVYVDGGTLQAAAAAVGWPKDKVGELRAVRARKSALEIVGKALEAGGAGLALTDTRVA